MQYFCNMKSAEFIESKFYNEKNSFLWVDEYKICSLTCLIILGLQRLQISDRFIHIINDKIYFAR